MSPRLVDAFWENKERKIWVVTLFPRNRKPRDQKIVRAKTRDGAIKTAQENSVYKSFLNSSARLANPVSDLGCVEVVA